MSCANKVGNHMLVSYAVVDTSTIFWLSHKSEIPLYVLLCSYSINHIGYTTKIVTSITHHLFGFVGQQALHAVTQCYSSYYNNAEVYRIAVNKASASIRNGCETHLWVFILNCPIPCLSLDSVTLQLWTEQPEALCVINFACYTIHFSPRKNAERKRERETDLSWLWNDILSEYIIYWFCTHTYLAGYLTSIYKLYM